jgi:glycosyltransferase involved in cell wall biosynthesis
MADRIMTISESTKKDLVEFLHVDPEKIDVTYLGTPEGFAPAPEQKREETRRRLGQILGRNVGGYAVVMSAGDRRKNSPGTVKAFAQACRELPDDYCMVVIGTPPKDGSLERAIEENSLRHRVFHLGHIDQSEYVDILSAAGMLAFMSFYEGFGLPLLEAMACGVPVLTSSVSSMPEVAGDAALLADPRDPADIASQMVRLAADQPLRRGLIEKGFERVRRFTWLQCAKDTLACYQRTLNGPGR